MQDSFTVRLNFSCMFKVKCFCNQKNFSRLFLFFSLAGKLYCRLFTENLRLFLIFGIFSGIGCCSHSFISTSTWFAWPLGFPDPEIGVMIEWLCGEPILWSSERLISDEAANIGCIHGMTHTGWSPKGEDMEQVPRSSGSASLR